jgi:hypothetical protein
MPDYAANIATIDEYDHFIRTIKAKNYDWITAVIGKDLINTRMIRELSKNDMAHKASYDTIDTCSFVNRPNFALIPELFDGKQRRVAVLLVNETTKNVISTDFKKEECGSITSHINSMKNINKCVENSVIYRGGVAKNNIVSILNLHITRNAELRHPFRVGNINSSWMYYVAIVKDGSVDGIEHSITGFNKHCIQRLRHHRLEKKLTQAIAS